MKMQTEKWIKIYEPAVFSDISYRMKSGLSLWGSAAPPVNLQQRRQTCRYPCRVSLFSELNNLDDISMSRFYSEMLGYTEEELILNFSSHIGRFAEETEMSETEIIQRLRQQYNGYRFSANSESVYNPFSVLKSLHHRAFHHYWFETGTPAFLVNLLREREYPIPEIENMAVDEQVFSTFDLDDLNPEAILFQTGYVTIKGIEDGLYRLDYPNREVKNAFLKHLMFAYSGGISGEEKSRFLHLSKHLRKEDLRLFLLDISENFS